MVAHQVNTNCSYQHEHVYSRSIIKNVKGYDRFQNDGAVNMQMMMQEQKAKPNDTTNNSVKILLSTDGSTCNTCELIH